MEIDGMIENMVVLRDKSIFAFFFFFLFLGQQWWKTFIPTLKYGLNQEELQFLFFVPHFCRELWCSVFLWSLKSVCLDRMGW